MHHATNKTRVYSTTSRPARTTNDRNLTMREERDASPGRRFGMSVGEAIVIALALGAAARMAEGGR